MSNKIEYLIFTLITAFLIFTPYASSANNQGSSAPLKIKKEYARLGSAKDKALGIIWVTPEKGWYTYSHNPGSAGKPTTFKAGCAGEMIHVDYVPGKERQSNLMPGKEISAYPGEFPIFVHLPLNRNCTEVQGTLSMLLCSKKRCRPVEKSITLRLPSIGGLRLAEDKPWWKLWKKAHSPAPSAEKKTISRDSVTEDNTETLSNYPKFNPRAHSPDLEVKNLGKAVLLALLAGLVLNFMPCVLPVISLKLRGMMPGSTTAESFTAQKKHFRHHNLFFALGMLFYFFLLAGIVTYTGMAWGEMFQKPGAVIALSCVVFALSLSLFDVYNLPIIDFKATNKAFHNPTLEALFTGFLATLLATPCSGPFLGGVLAWALIQPPATIAAVLLSIGLGMASPYLAMSVFPGLVRFMPRPGKWTRHLENALGFLLLATAIYLLGLLPGNLLISTLVLFLSIGLASWIWGIASGPGSTRRQRSTAAALGVLVVTASAIILFAGSGPGTKKIWQEFTKKDFLAQLGESTVVVDFTAEWCPNCKYLEKTVLKDKNIAPLQKKYGIKFFKVDLTREDADGEALLKEMNSQSIPLLAIFPKQNAQEAIILRDIFTEAELKNALDSVLAGKRHLQKVEHWN